MYAYHQCDESSLVQSEKQLMFSIKKTYDLYYYLMLLLVELVRYGESRIELARAKNLSTYEDLHPNTRLVDNRVLRQIAGSQQFQKYLSDNKLSWVNYHGLIKSLYQDLTNSEAYKSYISSEDSYNADKKFILRLLSDFFGTSEILEQSLEEQSIYWNDDSDFVISMIIKTLKSFKEGDLSSVTFMPMFKNEEDQAFAQTLFRKTIINGEKYYSLIKEHSKNWDVERIAFIDILIMEAAISELIEFPYIPTKVTLNEYIEISKYYSTDKSCTFINGILDKLINRLKCENIIVKKGRGLIGENESQVQP